MDQYPKTMFKTPRHAIILIKKEANTDNQTHYTVQILQSSIHPSQQ